MDNMKSFTGWQWLLIDAANQFGLDKELFEDRIKWAEDNLENLPDMYQQAENKPLFIKAVMAIGQARAGIASGHMVGVDACCSGMQIMSAMTGCIAGATATGMVDPNRRADAYQETTDEMTNQLGGAVNVARKDAKQAVMTSLYGSRKTPKDIFGEDSPELEAFYRAMLVVAPGAWELLQDLLNSWQDYTLAHEWKMPDGGDVRVKVMARRETRIEVDELNHASFTYEFYENEGLPKGHPKSKSNVANVTHSMDAYVLREMHRRCNYDRQVMEEVGINIQMELIQRDMGKAVNLEYQSGKIAYYQRQWQRSTLASSVILPFITEDTVQALDTEHLKALALIVDGMLQHKPFPLVTVHDEFKAHANNINWVRWHYREILAEVADSEVLSDIMSQIHKQPITYVRLSTNLGDYIRKSNYALS
jgi:hypothetical protein